MQDFPLAALVACALTPWLPGTTATALPQASTAFEVAYDFAGPPGFLPVELLATDDGGFLLAAVAQPMPSGTPTLDGVHIVAKFDANGVRQWRVARPHVGDVWFGNPAVVHERIDIDVDPNGNVYLLEPAMNASNLVKFDPDGNLVWQVGLDAANSTEGGFMTQLDASVLDEVVVAGHSFFNIFYPGGIAQSLTGSGAVRWTRSVGLMMPLGIDRGAQDEVYLWGPVDSVSNDAESLAVRALSATGATLWSHYEYSTVISGGDDRYRTIDGVVDASGELSILCRNDNVSSSREVVLLRLDTNGDRTLLARPFEGAGSSVEPTSLAVDAAGDYYVAAAVKSTGCGQVKSFRLLKFDRAGTLLQQLAPGAVAACEESRADRVIIGTDGSVTAVGVSFGSAPSQILARFDASGAEVYSRRWPGLALSHLELTATGLFDTGTRIVLDNRGNVLTATPREISGSFPNADIAVDLIKTVEGTAGVPYCGPANPNSTGLPAELAALGSSFVANNNVSLAASQLPPGSFVLFLVSETQGFNPASGSQGNLCLGGLIGRYVGPGQLQRADPAGRANLQLELTAIPQPNGPASAMAGDTWNFQAWFRDANPQATSNLSDGVSVQL